jgi:hypothetical protein
MTETVVAPPRRWLRRLVLVGMVFGVGWLIFVFSGSPRDAAPVMPDPNGYDDLIRAGALIKGDWPNKGDLAKAKIDEVRAVVEVNKASLELVKVGLGRDCMVRMIDTQEGLGDHLQDISRLRQVYRLLIGQGLVFEADGRPIEAAGCYRDLLKLSQAVTRNGLEIDVITGWSFETKAVSDLTRIRDQLPRDHVLALIGELEFLDRRRVTIAELDTRRERWFAGSFSPYLRTIMSLNGMDKKAKVDATKSLTKGRDKAERSCRFLLVSLAIHAFHEDRKAWPKTVEELVPDYLSSIPIDPNTDKPLEYPSNAEGMLTDDLSAVARPDGEVKAKP